MAHEIRTAQSYGERWRKLVVLVLDGHDFDVDGRLGHRPVFENGDELQDGSVVGGGSLEFQCRGKEVGKHAVENPMQQTVSLRPMT